MNNKTTTIIALAFASLVLGAYELGKRQPRPLPPGVQARLDHLHELERENIRHAEACNDPNCERDLILYCSGGANFVFPEEQ